MDITKGDSGYSQHVFSGDQDLKIANYLFEISSNWARGKIETIMISIVVDPLQNADSFRNLLDQYAKKIKANPNVYKAFYLNSARTEEDILEQYKWLDDLFTNLIKDSEEILKEIILGQILILGRYAVGKTSIVNRINTNSFDSNVRPTLGIQAVKLVLENYKIHAFDVGGQTKIQDIWLKFSRIPDAIIYVVDVTSNDEQKKEEQLFFEKIMERFFANTSIKSKEKRNIPVLILGNKIDLNPELKKMDIELNLNPKKYKLCYKIGLTSALKNIGIMRYFRWLIAQLIDLTCSQEED
jgi:small GTP-binding protein